MVLIREGLMMVCNKTNLLPNQLIYGTVYICLRANIFGTSEILLNDSKVDTYGRFSRFCELA